VTHTGRMSTPIRPGTARRLGLRPPPMPVGPAFAARQLTGEQRTAIERAWLLHDDGIPPRFATGGLVADPLRRGDEMTVLVDEGCAYVTPDIARRYGTDFLAQLGGIPPENVHTVRP